MLVLQISKNFFFKFLFVRPFFVVITALPSHSDFSTVIFSMRTFRPDSETSSIFAAAIALLFTSLQNFAWAFLQTIPQYWTMLYPEQFQSQDTHISQIFLRTNSNLHMQTFFQTNWKNILEKSILLSKKSVEIPNQILQKFKTFHANFQNNPYKLSKRSKQTWFKN